MIIYVDIDNTICKTSGMEYAAAVPIKEKIDKVNKLFSEGNTIIYWTARGVGSGISHRQLTVRQLEEWGCDYSGIRFDKPLYDKFYDDRAFNETEL